MLRLIIAVIGLVLVAGGPARAQDASSAVSLARALYQPSSAPRTGLDRYFVQDLAAALEADLSTSQPIVAADYRFDASERPSRDLEFSSTDSPAGAGVLVSFDGQQVLVELCRRPDGQWRIVDVRDPDAFWSTRAYMQLHPNAVSCQ